MVLGGVASLLHVGDTTVQFDRLCMHDPCCSAAPPKIDHALLGNARHVDPMYLYHAELAERPKERHVVVGTLRSVEGIVGALLHRWVGRMVSCL